MHDRAKSAQPERDRAPAVRWEKKEILKKGKLSKVCANYIHIKKNGGLYAMDMVFYMRDPKLWNYFLSLPSPVRAALLRHDVYVSTLGELQLMAEHYRSELDL